MWSFVFLFLIIAALGVICYIVLRKFFQLSNLDLESLAEEKAAQKKKEIISNRLDEKGRDIKNIWQKRLAPIVRFWKKRQLNFRVYVGKVERLFRHEQSVKDKEEQKSMTTMEREKRIGELLQTADLRRQEGDFDKAEELYISVIKIDSKLASAYRGLAETYLSKDEVEEALQTFDFLSRLTPQDDNLFMRLGEVHEKQGDLDKAVGYYEQAVVLNDAIAPRFYHLAELLLRLKQAEVALEAVSHAVELEAKNPKYLDLLIECAIISGRLEEAQQGFDSLRLVNPENHKLEEYREKIAQLEKDSKKGK